MPKQKRSDDWGFPRWRSYGEKGRHAAKLRLCDREGCNEVGDRPAPGLGRLMGALGAFYAIAAVVAATAGAEYAVAAMLASLIPYSAALLLYAMARSKTAEEGGRLRDASAEDLDPWPGIGLDDETPLGDTPEHSEAERVEIPRPPQRGR